MYFQFNNTNAKIDLIVYLIIFFKIYLGVVQNLLIDVIYF
jgi:hypothetical protein